MESDIDEEEEGQFEDIQTYLDHHNTYQESQNIRKEYTKRLLDLDDERDYRDIDSMYETYSQDQAHIPDIVVLLHCGCLSLNPFIEISIQNNSSSSDVLNIQASISISPKFESK